MGQKPIVLKGERVWRTYTGGKNISKMHGEKEIDNHFPEEWMYSIIRAKNTGRENIVEGICKTEASPERTLQQIIMENLEKTLGAEHIKKWGGIMGILVKIIDAEERLTIQVHPDKKTARKLFNSQFGKTECWHILDVRKNQEEEAHIYLGFKEGITREKWEECFWKQDIERMLSMLNKVTVKKGDTYLVKGGVPHAIGAGCVLIEVQEPTDYTIRVERVTPSGFQIDDEMCHQGLGFEKMFECFSYEGNTKESIIKKYCISPQKKTEDCYQLVGEKDTKCFSIDRLWIEEEQEFEGEGVFSCIYVMDGRGILKCKDQINEIQKNTQIFIPAECIQYSIMKTGDERLEILKIYGPT